ncbi:unnamed protein product [Sympodiomycopsis kandeliae]
MDSKLDAVSTPSAPATPNHIAGDEDEVKPPPTKHKHSSFNGSDSGSGFGLLNYPMKTGEVAKHTAADMALLERRQSKMALMETLGLSWPQVSQQAVDAVKARWATDLCLLGKTALTALEPSAHETQHVLQLNKILSLAWKAEVFDKHAEQLTILGLGNKAIDWRTHEDSDQSSLGPDFRPDAVMVAPKIKDADLRRPGGAQLVRLPIEIKKQGGSPEIGQCGSYSVAFRAPGARYSMALSIRHTTLRLMVLSTSQWAELGKVDYYDILSVEPLLEILALAMLPPDLTLQRMWSDQIPLLWSAESEALYTNGLQAGSIDWQRPRRNFKPLNGSPSGPIYNSLQVFGSRTQVWTVDGTIECQGEELEEGSYVVVAKFLRPGKAINTVVFQERLHQQLQLHGRPLLIEECIGVWFSEEGLRLRDRRILVVQIFRGPAKATWAESVDGMTLAAAWTAFADAIRVLWSSRPLHHRDISPLNLMWIPKTTGTRRSSPQPLQVSPGDQLTSSLLDLDNARWNLEPSEFGRRSARQRQLSHDDAWTGTPSFMARATFLMDPQQPERTHQHWHDLESLVLCLLYMVYMRFRSLAGIGEVFQSWIHNPLEWNDHTVLFRGLVPRLRQQIVSQRLQISKGDLKQMQVTLTRLVSLEEAFLPTTVQSLDATEEDEIAGLFGLTEEAEEGLFASCLAVAEKAQQELSALEPAGLAATGPVLRQRNTNTTMRVREALSSKLSPSAPKSTSLKRKSKASPSKSRSAPSSSVLR